MTGDRGVSAQSAHAELGESLIAVPESFPLDGDGRSVQVPVAPTKETAADSPPTPVLVTWTELRGVWRVFASVEWLLRDRAGYFAEIRERKALGIKLRNMVISSAILFALYGLLMGVSNSWQQALASAVKLPGLFLITLLICLPTLYFLNYSLFLLLNVGVLALMTWWGMRFLIQGMHHVQQGYLGVGRGRILLFWVLVFAFVGTQMAWAMRPFVGAPEAPFELIRESQGSFYTGVFYNLRNLLGF
jgi:hypothetical protein